MNLSEAMESTIGLIWFDYIRIYKEFNGEGSEVRHARMVSEQVQ